MEILILNLNREQYRSDDNFIVYTHRVPAFKKEEKIKYLVVNILNNEALDLLLVSIYSSKPEKRYPKEHTIYNFTYMKEEILNKTTLSQHKGFFVFILENKEPGKNKIVAIKLNKEYSLEIRLEVAGYKERPITEEQIKNAVCYDFLLLKLQTRDEDYTIYEFPIKNQEINKQKYIAIATKIKEPWDFLFFYIGPEL